ncbi:substrate-binding and VWA domain-containing protein [Acrocarpospora catenulata]|uniref:substrate-binding and VWA domain-containing protein n=1 Tax=Acrocarpospora catenulata TaxID=2836182 RepID=UPI001BD92C26|nr:substrate-binding and VWA domain-containing protein [Acrocarpospora catenulata]
MGRHRTEDLEGYLPEPPPQRRRGGAGKVLVPLAGAVALAVLLGVAAYVVVHKDPGCGPDKVALQVITAKDVEPAITEIAGRFAKSGTTVDGKCVAITVKGADSAGVAAALSGKISGENTVNPDIWIPDSSLWLAGLPKDGPAEVTGNAAHSPVVLTAPKAAAEQLASAFQPSWAGMVNAANAANPDGLAKKVRVLVLDPGLNAAGMGALLAAAGVLRAGGGENTEELLAGVLRQLSGSKVGSTDSLFATLSKQATRVPIGVTSEQSVWSFNTKNDNAAVALYPAEGTVNLDYPIVTTGGEGVTAKAAKEFATELVSAAAKKTIQEHGFRTPTGQGSALTAERGLNPKAPQAIPLPDAKTINTLAQSWKLINLGTRLLSIIDISGTMALPADSTGVTRMQAIGQVGLEGLKLFPDKTEIGTWVFSDNLNGQGVDWKEMIPIGPLAQRIDGVTRRELVAKDLQSLKAIPTGNTGLNDTLWAAYQKMTKEYAADKVNTILLFTDGVGNDDPNGGISDATVLRRLKQTYDPEKPVSILIISFNTTADENRAQMTALARATGGAAYFPQTVLEIRNIFLKGIARRLCAPNCPTAQQ